MAEDSIIPTICISSLYRLGDILPTIQETAKSKGEAGYPTLLFRGMKAGGKLNSSIAKYEEAAFKKDKAMFKAFKDVYTAHGSPVGNLCEVDLFALARHYGLQNRCLDWSGNLLVALWFAIHEEDDNGGSRLCSAGEKIVVWVLAPSINDYAKDNSKLEIYPSGHSGRTRIFKANTITVRIKNQNSYLMRQVFVYRNGHRTNLSKNLILEEVEKNDTFRGKLTKIEICLSASELSRCDKTLKEHGISETFVFPDKKSERGELLEMIVKEAEDAHSVSGKT